MKQLKLNLTYFKVLETIKQLNDDHFYPLNQGIYKILVGAEDEETVKFSYISTYGSLTSFTSKKVCRYTLMLFRYGYLSKVFDPSSKKLYFQLTEKGLESVSDFKKNHRISLKKKSRKVSPSIVKID